MLIIFNNKNIIINNNNLKKINVKSDYINGEK